MSRIGKKPIQIPQGVEAKIESNRVFVKGPKGELNMEFCPEVKVEQKEGSVIVSPALENKKTKAIWGLTRTLISNMIEGTTKGFEKKLEIQGVGYKANVEGKDFPSCKNGKAGRDRI